MNHTDSNPSAALADVTRRLAGHPPGTPGHAAALADLEALAAASTHVDAWWNLAAYYLQVRSHPDAAARAVHWLERCAKAGWAPAIDRLAKARVNAGDIEAGLDGFSALALHGYARPAWELAYVLAGLGRMQAAADWLVRACALACPPAYCSLGWRLSQGLGLPAQPVLGQALLRRAVDARYPGAAALAARVRLDAAQQAEADQWHARLRANLANAPLERLAPDRAPVGTAGAGAAAVALEQHFATMALSGVGTGADGRLCWTGGTVPEPAATREWSTLSERPRVRVCEGFATDEECAWLMHRSGALLRRARDYDVVSGANDLSEVEQFTGTGMVIDPMEDDVVSSALRRRIASLTRWDESRVEPCSVIRYDPGEQYQAHVDFFTAEQIEANRRERRDHGGQRIATVLVCLEAPAEGGETLYGHVGLQVPWRRGMALVHDNVLSDGQPDVHSVHTGTAVRAGEKWLLRTTLREHPLVASGGAA